MDNEQMDNRVDFIDIKSFKELYKENRQNGILCQDIKIAKTEIISVLVREDEKLYNTIKQSMLQHLTRQLLEVFIEFPNDIFHINCKIKEIDNPFLNTDLNPSVEIIAIAYVFSGLRYSDRRR